jgi:hypothetical protein
VLLKHTHSCILALSYAGHPSNAQYAVAGVMDLSEECVQNLVVLWKQATRVADECMVLKGQGQHVDEYATGFLERCRFVLEVDPGSLRLSDGFDDFADTEHDFDDDIPPSTTASPLSLVRQTSRYVKAQQITSLLRSTMQALNQLQNTQGTRRLKKIRSLLDVQHSNANLMHPVHVHVRTLMVFLLTPVDLSALRCASADANARWLGRTMALDYFLKCAEILSGVSAARSELLRWFSGALRVQDHPGQTTSTSCYKAHLLSHVDVIGHSHKTVLMQQYFDLVGRFLRHASHLDVVSQLHVLEACSLPFQNTQDIEPVLSINLISSLTPLISFTGSNSGLWQWWESQSEGRGRKQWVQSADRRRQPWNLVCSVRVGM